MTEEMARASARVVEQACDVLLAIARDEQAPGIRGFAEALGLSKSTLQRILASLEKAGFVAFDSSRQCYVLTSRMLQLASGFHRDFNLLPLLREPMERLCAATRETVTFSVENDGYRITAFQVPSPQDLRLVTDMGHRYPLIVGATGRVLLAAMTPDRLDTVLGQYFDADGKPTIAVRGNVTEASVRAGVEAARAAGHAESHAEWASGGAGLAVPLVSPDRTNAALSIYAPDSRLTEEITAEYLNRLHHVADEFARANPRVSA